MNYKKNLSEPWFSLISLKIKKYEGRLDKGEFSKMKKGDIMIFENNDMGFLRTVKCKITSIKKYTTFKDFLEKKKLKRCLPTIQTIDQGVQVYRKFYNKKDEETYGVLAIKMKPII